MSTYRPSYSNDTSSNRDRGRTSEPNHGIPYRVQASGSRHAGGSGRRTHHGSIESRGLSRGRGEVQDELEEGELLEDTGTEQSGQRPAMSGNSQRSGSPSTVSRVSGPSGHDDWKERMQDNFEQTRAALVRWMRNLRYLYPPSSSWLYSTKTVEIGDMVLVPWIVYCKDRKAITTRNHKWLPGFGGEVMNKYRWAIVFNKDTRGKLYIWFTYTFSNTSMADKRLETVEDELTGEIRPALADYMQVVTINDNNKNDPVESEPSCFKGDSEESMQLICHSVGGYRAKKKVSFLRINETFVHEDRTPLQVRAKVIGKEEIAKLRKINKAMSERTEKALKRAEENWAGTPYTGAMPINVPPGTLASNSASGQATSPPRHTPTDMLPPPSRDRTCSGGAIASNRGRDDAMNFENQALDAPMDVQLGNAASNTISHGSSANTSRPPNTLMDGLGLQTTANAGGSRSRESIRNSLRNSLNPPRNTQRDQGRKRQPDSPERDARPAQRRR